MKLALFDLFYSALITLQIILVYRLLFALAFIKPLVALVVAIAFTAFIAFLANKVAKELQQ